MLTKKAHSQQLITARVHSRVTSVQLIDKKKKDVFFRNLVVEATKKMDALKIWSNLHLFRVCPRVMFQISWFPPQAGESGPWGEKKVQRLLKDLAPVFLTAMSELICRVLKFTECSTLNPKMANDVKRKQNYKWQFACPLFRLHVCPYKPRRFLWIRLPVNKSGQSLKTTWNGSERSTRFRTYCRLKGWLEIGERLRTG